MKKLTLAAASVALALGLTACNMQDDTTTAKQPGGEREMAG